MGGTGHWPVLAGYQPAKSPGQFGSLADELISSIILGGKLPPSTARLAVPPKTNCIDTAKP